MTEDDGVSFVLLLPHAAPLLSLGEPWRNMLHATSFYLHVFTSSFPTTTKEPDATPHSLHSLHSKCQDCFHAWGNTQGSNVHQQDGGRLCHRQSLQKHCNCRDVGLDQTDAGPADNALTSLIAADFAADR